jgi:hypothetical protein
VLGSRGLQLKVTKVTRPSTVTKGDGLSEAEVVAIEESPRRPGGVNLGVQGSGNQWEIIVDFLYRDALEMMVALAQDAGQMQQAEARFQQGTYVWRS